MGTYPACHSSGKPCWPLPWPRGCSSAGVPRISLRCPAVAGTAAGAHPGRGALAQLLSGLRQSADPSEGWEEGARPSSAASGARSAPLLPRRGGWPHGKTARRAAGPCRGFPKKGLNSSVEFATSLTTPFPVRGCVQPLFFSLSLFFSLLSPCPQTQRSWQCHAPPEPAGVTLAGTRRRHRRAMARLQVRTRRRRLPPWPLRSPH